MRLYKLPGLVELWRGQNDGTSIVTVAFSTDGNRFLTGGDSGTIQVWDTATRQCLRTLRASHLNRLDYITSARFTPDGRIVAGCCDGKLCIW